MDRAAVSIDGGYLAKALDRDFRRTKVDLLAFSDKLCLGSERIRTYYYNCMPYQSSPPTDEERKRFAAMDRFIYNLKRLPRFEVRLGKLVYVKGEFIQKRIDILLAVDLVRMNWSRQIQKAVLVTGDSDFVPAINAAKDAGVVVQLYYSPKSIHDELLLACDDKIEITWKLIKSVKLRTR